MNEHSVQGGRAVGVAVHIHKNIIIDENTSNSDYLDKIKRSIQTFLRAETVQYSSENLSEDANPSKLFYS